jgi:GNAT superfamily N-acetyltransferase
MNGRFRLKRASVDDLEVLVKHRECMWRDIHDDPDDKISLSSRLYRSWLRRKLKSGRVIAYIVANEKGKPVASGCIWLQASLPAPRRLRPLTPYIMSMYTASSYRKKGLATMVINEIINWCREQKYSQVRLHASDFGRPLYEKLGFKPTSEMRLELS